MYPSETMPRLIIRLPQHLKVWLGAEAARNGCSQNSEVVRAIRERMERITTGKGAE